jgi:hypothetical protein
MSYHSDKTSVRKPAWFHNVGTLTLTDLTYLLGHRVSLHGLHKKHVDNLHIKDHFCYKMYFAQNVYFTKLCLHTILVQNLLCHFHLSL